MGDNVLNVLAHLPLKTLIRRRRRKRGNGTMKRNEEKRNKHKANSCFISIHHHLANNYLCHLTFGSMNSHHTSYLYKYLHLLPKLFLGTDYFSHPLPCSVLRAMYSRFYYILHSDSSQIFLIGWSSLYPESFFPIVCITSFLGFSFYIAMVNFYFNKFHQFSMCFMPLRVSIVSLILSVPLTGALVNSNYTTTYLIWHKPPHRLEVGKREISNKYSAFSALHIPRGFKLR